MTDDGLGPQDPTEQLTMEQLYEHAPCGYLTTSADGVVLKVNATLLRWTGRAREEVLGRSFAELLTPGARLFYETHYAAVLHLQGRVDGVALDLATADGSVAPVLVTAEQHAGSDGRPGVVHATLFSTRARSVYEQELRRSRQAAERSAERLQLVHDVREACRSALTPSDVAVALVQALTQATRGGIVAVWLADDGGRLLLQQGERTPLAPAVVHLEERLPVAVAARTQTALVLGQRELRTQWPQPAALLEQAGRTALLAVPLVAEGAVLGVAQVLLRRDRTMGADELQAWDAVGCEAGQALLRCELPAHLRGLPLRDSVTGTATPALFGERVAAALARGADASRPVAVVVLDASGPAGPDEDAARPLDDAAMAELGRRLRDAAGHEQAARVGRQRFAVLAGERDVGQVHLEAERLVAALNGPGVLVSAGAAVVEPSSDGRVVSVSALLGWASRALDDACARGPGRVVVHGPGDRAAARALVDAERTLRRALEGDDVVVEYQPVVHLRTGRVVGVEALCRLRLPDGRLLAPALFIDAAEDSGLVLPLGRRMLATACAQQRAWAGQGRHVDVAVNIGAGQAAAPGFAGEVLDVLSDTGCPPQRLVLELTESALLTATPATLRSFEQVRDAGVRVALDDFGTRYASLDYVRSFPLDELKIDQSFVAGLPRSRVARAIVRMVSQLAAELELACVAEGIETAAQALFLRDLEVLGQGFALGQPVAPEDVPLWVTPTAWLPTAPAWARPTPSHGA